MGEAAEERRGGSDHRKSTSTAEEEKRKRGAEEEHPGREGKYGAPHLSGKTCTRWTPLCGLAGQKPSLLAAVAISWKALWTQCAGQIGKPGFKQPYQAHSRFTQDDDSWCFSAPSLSPLTEFYCFTLEDYKWGGVLRTYLSLRA